MTSILDMLPIEIIEQIIGTLATDDHRDRPYKSPNVKACSLTCWAFYFRSRPHIFRAVKLYDRFRLRTRSSVAAFVRLITTIPEIVDYVRELHYVLQDAASTRGRKPPFVPTALEQLKNLECLIISPEQGLVYWSYVHTPQRSVLLRIMQFPKIVSLQLTAVWGFDPLDLIPCRNLERLSLQDVVMAQDEDKKASELIQHLESIRLRTIDLKYSGVHAASVMAEPNKTTGRSILNVEAVEKATIQVEANKHLQSIAKVFIEKARNLESAHFIVEGRYGLYRRDINIIGALATSISALRFLRIDVYITGVCVDPFYQIAQALQEGLQDGITNVEVLRLRVQLPRRVESTTGVGWGLLETILLGHGWPKLRQVDLSIILEGLRRDKWLEEVILKLPQTQFLGLSSSPSLEFNFVASEGCEKRRVTAHIY